MENIKIVVNKDPDFYFIDKSFINEKERCVHLPVVMHKKKEIPDIDYHVVPHMERDLKRKYPEVVFTGRWDVVPGENGIKEYLFFYEKMPEPNVS